jgi:hypothetical protein
MLSDLYLGIIGIKRSRLLNLTVLKCHIEAPRVHYTYCVPTVPDPVWKWCRERISLDRKFVNRTQLNQTNVEREPTERTQSLAVRIADIFVPLFTSCYRNKSP